MVSRLVLLPILVSAGALLGAQGGMGTLGAVRAGIEGYPEYLVGLMGSGFSVGMLVGCIFSAALIRRAGYIRTFASFCSLGAMAVLSMALYVDGWFWIVGRFALGLVMAVTATVLESWLNSLAESSDRGRILSLYRIVDLAAVTGVQFLIPFMGAETMAIFVALAMFYCLALLPVSLSRIEAPPPPESSKLNLGVLWSISPVACVSIFLIGATNAAFRQVGPLYAQAIGLDLSEVATFVAVGIMASAITQYPLGWLSDRFDRRWVMIGSTLAASVGSLMLALGPVEWVYPGIFIFGGFSVSLYSLAAAHANDHAKPNQYIDVAIGGIMIFSFGAIIGPFIASLIMQHFGPPSFFMYICAVHMMLVVYVFWRMTQRAAPGRAFRTRFVGLLRTSPVFMRLARGRRNEDEG